MIDLVDSQSRIAVEEEEEEEEENQVGKKQQGRAVQVVNLDDEDNYDDYNGVFLIPSATAPINSNNDRRNNESSLSASVAPPKKPISNDAHVVSMIHSDDFGVEIVDPVTSSSSSLKRKREHNKEKLPSTLHQILNVFPNAKPAYVESLLLQYNDDVSDVLSIMAEKGYHKIEYLQEKSSSSSSNSGMNITSDQTEYDYDNIKQNMTAL